MKKDFNKLEELLFNASTYDSNGNDIWADVHGLLIELGGKIDEVEKRMECANKCATEIQSAILIYENLFEKEGTFYVTKIDHGHYSQILQASNDIHNSLNLNDDMCVVDNWFNLFSPTPKVEDEETYPIVNCMDCGHPQPLLEENVHVDKLGRHVVCEQCEGSFNVGGDELKPIAVGNIEYDFPEEVYTIGNADNTEIIGDVYESEFISMLDLGVIITENDNGFPFGKTNYIVLDNKFISIVKKKQIDLSKVPIIKKEVFMTFHSSWGEIDCDSEGKVLEIRGDEYASDGERSYLYDIAKFDLVEFGKFCESKNITMGEADDILVVGFWKKDNTYNEADRDWRRSDEEPPTMLCKTPQTHEFVKDIIAKLKVIDVDGETMEYILRQVGMEEQMLKQLFAQSTNDEIDYLHDVRNGKG
jgi:hypothetical protein